MPVTENGVGFSSVTETKQEHFRMILRTQLLIVKAIFKKYPYFMQKFHYFDINAGAGMSKGRPGSPLIFLDEIALAGLDYSAVFIDRDTENIRQLYELTKAEKNIQLICGEHAEVLPQLFVNDNKRRFGLLYTDPNGIFNAELLQEFSQQPCFQATDILINCPASAVKRVKNSPKCDDNRCLQDRLSIIDKKFWLVRDALKNSTWQWTFLLGTNWTKFPEFHRIGMVKMESERGREIFERLNFTSMERMSRHQAGLFDTKFLSYDDYLRSAEFSVIRKQVFQRANGVCEVCHKQHATEPHHIKYSNWHDGELDTPANLVAVCHPCHCKIHHKEN